MADLVLWHPGFFGVKPQMIIKGGSIAWAQMGDANASIPTPQPVMHFRANVFLVKKTCMILWSFYVIAS